jgi:hypothetical protein
MRAAKAQIEQVEAQLAEEQYQWWQSMEDAA